MGTVKDRPLLLKKTVKVREKKIGREVKRLEEKMKRWKNSRASVYDKATDVKYCRSMAIIIHWGYNI